jgi:hypothetical protein
MASIILCKSLTSITFFKSIGTATNRMIVNSRGSKGIENQKRKDSFFTNILNFNISANNMAFLITNF